MYRSCSLEIERERESTVLYPVGCGNEVSQKALDVTPRQDRAQSDYEIERAGIFAVTRDLQEDP